MMRIATKYPRIAERHFERTGRQVEVIEVKGSVELAPLIGLGDGIVDLVATGRTLEENDLEVREEILDCTARFVANRVAHKLRAARGRRADGAVAGGRAAVRVRRFEWEGAARDRGRDPRLGGGVGARRSTSTRSSGRWSEGGDEAVLRLTARFDATESPPILVAGRTGGTGGGAGRRSTRGPRRDGGRGGEHPRRRRGPDRPRAA